MMIVLLQETITGLVVAVFLISSTRADFSANSDRTCEEQNRFQISYPFGFSEDSPIRLNCSDAGDVRVGEFVIRNITGGNIVIDFPAKCDRPIGEVNGLFGPNYAPTWQNGFLLKNCDTKRTDCLIPTRMVQNRFELEGCDLPGDHFSCYSEGIGGSDFMANESLRGTECGVLFSSFAIDANNGSGSGRNPEVVLDFGAVVLGWWLEGACNCSANATCTTVRVAEGRLGFRCGCEEGFDGDGFAGGAGCKQPVHDHCSPTRFMTARCGSRRKIRVLIGGIISGATLMALLTVLCFYARRRLRTLNSQMSAKRLLSQSACTSSIPLYPYREIERATSGFSEKQRLGTGAYGTVYAGKLHNDEWVAIKKIRNRDAEGIEQVMNEIKLLSSVSHPNLVQLLGCCIENGEQILVYEYMPNGTLAQHLQRERGKGLPWTIRLTIATETAHAIAYLHSSMNPPIYHRDIKSSNILLDYNFNSKVADFGLSRHGMMDDYSHISTAPQGTPGYLDPQYHQNFHLSDKSDVYSFGVVLVEIITALKVVDFSRSHCEVNLAALAVDRIGKGRLDEIIDPSLDPNRDAWTLSSLHKVAELAFRCLAYHKDMRPSMTEVADELEQVRLSAWAPVEDNICMASSSVASSCSSPYGGSEKSVSGVVVKKGGVGSRRLTVQQQRTPDSLVPMKEIKHGSPISVQDPWLSEWSSPSTNSLLGKVVK